MATLNSWGGLRVKTLAIVSMLVVSLTFATAASAKVQLNPFAQLGGEVDLTTGGEYCLEHSGDTCIANTENAASGAAPGWFKNPASVAVDQSTHDFYVAEELNQRVQKFASNGEFLEMFGMSVLTSGASGEGALTENSDEISSVVTTSRQFAAGQTITGPGIQAGTRIVEVGEGTITLSKSPTVTGVVTGVALTVAAAVTGVAVNEQQQVAITGAPTGGTFSLTYKTPNPSSSEVTTPELPFDASAAEVKAALQGTSNMGAVGGEVAVVGAAGGPYTIEFKGARYEDTNVQQLEATSNLSGGASPEVLVKTTVQGDGAPADDVCDKAQASECEIGLSLEGEKGSQLPGQLEEPGGVAVDNSCYEAKLTEVTVPTCAATYPANGNVFVEDSENHRIQEFTPNGEFVAMIGGDVNKTAVTNGGGEAERNLCTEAEIESPAKVECGKGVENETTSTGPRGQFKTWPSGPGNLLFVALNSKRSPAEDVLYVGDEGRVQEFEASTGHWRRDLVLTPEQKVHALTAAPNGDLYVSQAEVEGVHVYEPESVGGTQLTPFEAGSHLLKSGSLTGLAIDPAGHIAVVENGTGELYSSTGKLLSTYGVGFAQAIAFDDASEDLYASKSELRKVIVFSPAITPDALTGAASPVGTATATLTGEIEPDGFGASSKFEYGVCPSRYPSTAPCSESPYGSSMVSTPGTESASEAKAAVQSSLTGLLPNQTYHYRLAAENSSGTTSGEERVFVTEPLPPAIAAAPRASFVTPSTAILSGAVNPENATTEYWFEYVGQQQFGETGWTGAKKTTVVTTPTYTTTTLSSAEEAVGLEPGATYRVRLVAENEHAETTDGPETTFVAALTPVPTAATGGYSGLTATGAVISASVNPDGVPATYAFELGVYAGAGTQYGVVFSGPGGAGTTPIEQTLALTGLQPGVTYAYRVSITSGYIPGSHTQQGATVLFTTPGLPAAIAPPPLVAQLPVPDVKFPAVAKHPSKKKKPKKKKKKKRAHRGGKHKPAKKHKKA